MFGRPLTGTVALTWLSGLCVSITPRAMLAGVFIPLVLSTKLKRSTGRVQTKNSPTSEFEANNLILEKLLVLKTATKTTNNLYTDLPRSSNHVTATGQSQKGTAGIKLEQKPRPVLDFEMYVLVYKKLESLSKTQQK